MVASFRMSDGRAITISLDLGGNVAAANEDGVLFHAQWSGVGGKLLDVKAMGGGRVDLDIVAAVERFLRDGPPR